MFEKKYFDVNEESGFKLSNHNSALLLKSLIKCKGELTSSIIFGDDRMADHTRACGVRICLPENQIEKFKQLTGFTLTPPPVIRANNYVESVDYDY